MDYNGDGKIDGADNLHMGTLHEHRSGGGGGCGCLSPFLLPFTVFFGIYVLSKLFG